METSSQPGALHQEEEELCRDILALTVKEVLDELMPATQDYTIQTKACATRTGLGRLLAAAPQDRCEDPAFERKYLELAKASWKSLASTRFTNVLEEEKQRRSSAGSDTVSEYIHRGPELSQRSHKRVASAEPQETDRVKKIRAELTSERRLKKALRNEARKKDRYTVSQSQVVQSVNMSAADVPISPHGWQGKDFIGRERLKLTEKLLNRDPELMETLRAFTHVPYRAEGQAPTRIVDCEGRLLIYRSKVAEWQKELLRELGIAIQKFTEETSQGPHDIQKNNRGDHRFCIGGVDRQCKSEPKVSGWEGIGSNAAALKALFELLVMQRFNAYVTALVEKHFPNIAKRMKEDMEEVCKKYGFPPSPFGLFWNFCINSPVFPGGIKNVICVPHTDAKNGAILVCAVMVYHYGACATNADEKIWLVFWEAGIIMQIPAGCIVIYPSALLLHFNVNIDDVLLVTKDGEYPTKDNTASLKEGNTLQGGRGSIVWFTQASMLMSAELPTDTKREAEELEKKLQKANPRDTPYINTTFDAAAALEKGYFPYNVDPVS